MSRGWKSKVLADLVCGAGLLHRQLSSHCVLTWRKSEEALWGLLDKGTDPIPEDSCFMSWNSSFNHFPKASPPNTITLRVRFQHVDFGAGDTYLQSIATRLCQLEMVSSYFF